MLKKCFSLAAVTALGGSIVWAGCSSEEPATIPPTNDAGDAGPTDAGTSADTGTQQPTGDAGDKKDSGSPPGVDITYGSCSAFTKCGGDLVGSWKVSGGCISSTAFDSAKAKCDGLEESDVVIKASGTVVATATMIERKTSATLTAKVAIPKDCSPLPDCGLIAAGLQSGALPGAPTFDKATCKDSGTICNCDVEATLTEDASDAYTAKDGVVSTTNPDRTFDYCVQGTKLSYEETTKSKDFQLPFTVELTN
jgi:hypothetical protein